MYGADLHPEFIDLGYELFLDKDRLQVTFHGNVDVFDADSALKQLDGTIDICHASSFFPMFDWDSQVRIAKRIIQVLKPKPGSLVLGTQKASAAPGEYGSEWGPADKTYRHDVESFEKLWMLVGQETGTQWAVDSTLHKTTMRFSLMQDPNFRFQYYSIRRI
ncbi:MAG: hypothetical protein M1839_006708 [Geoglossum umbratile]|nr:MAG: hypothetical protein M1839_006708 [Geoglossum umbratile]